jgi:hypothetical protein
MLVEELRVELPGEGPDTEREEKKEEDARTEQEYARRAEGLPAEKAAALAVRIAEKHEE